MKKYATLSLILFILNSCGIKTPAISSNISSSLFSFYSKNETAMYKLNDEINLKNSFILLIYSPQCLYCRLSENQINECIDANKVVFYTLNTDNTKNISSQNFYIEAIKSYKYQDKYNEYKDLFETEFKLYTPTLICIKDGLPIFSLIGYNKSDYKERVYTLISKIKATNK